jgi:hypothetical protein
VKALDEFTQQDYVEKIKTQITSESLPSDKEELLAFLYEKAIHI